MWLCRCLREESEVSVSTSELNGEDGGGVFFGQVKGISFNRICECRNVACRGGCFLNITPRYIYHDGIWDLRRGYECDDVRFSFQWDIPVVENLIHLGEVVKSGAEVGGFMLHSMIEG